MSKRLNWIIEPKLFACIVMQIQDDRQSSFYNQIVALASLNTAACEYANSLEIRSMGTKSIAPNRELSPSFRSYIEDAFANLHNVKSVSLSRTSCIIGTHTLIWR